MTKILSKWVILPLIILCIIACGSSNLDGVTTVTLGGWQSSPTEKQLLEQVLKEFEAKHPKVKVKLEVITGQYMDVIKTRLIGDAAPDIFYLDAYEAPLLMIHDVLEPLDDYIKRTDNFDVADFEPSLFKAFQYNGIIYGLPKDFSTLALFYNKQLFKQANLTQPPQTWEELRDYSQKLTVDKNRDGRNERYGLGINQELARLYFFIKAFGANLVDKNGYATFATPESFKSLKTVIDLYRNYQSAALPSDVGASSGSEMFGQGKTAMVIEGSWAIPYLKDTFPKIKFATAEVPSLGSKKGTMAYTVAYVMNKQAQHKEAAWQLISYLTGKEGMKAWGKAGLVLPSRLSVLSELGYQKNPLYAPFIKGAAYATIWQAGETLPTIQTHFDNQFLSALLGEQSLESAMNKAQESANEEIRAGDY
ncbi:MULTISPECIES: ABC transporter substrate-binding protein [Moorena]|uniref:CUT1 family carbohydrate ABC transporter, TC 3.A.1.1.-, substrate-binding protein n=1 Tax=Moorena producens 3L TaxID=489825 RepID=F4XY09_9CYAN|nr:MULTISPECIES: ABC transporter substrate-binding protein [Moorena]EGJ30515.1 CUT1 family carbohydrate ABC transporter, TC 3.A.1.1.-, substrate-binding protein [Moorena producens 3L]NEP66959.1 ABC transporter substrate-binding protein [Moorena sp. SIO3A5]OLT69542.1 ABC transporter substrate-binding protein [Moorena producens 3L]